MRVNIAVPVTVEHEGGTRYVPLPPELWLWSGEGSCCCGKCGGTAWWDTLAVPAVPRPEAVEWAKGQGRQSVYQRTWMVHFPELHGSREVYVNLGRAAETADEGKARRAR